VCWLIPLLASSAGAQAVDLQLRIAWGGGSNRQWRGEIRVSEGRLSDLTPLGLEADEPGSMQRVAGAVLIEQRSARIYDGLDVRVEADQRAQIIVELTPVDAPEQAKRIQLPLSELIEEMRSEAIDDKQNRLLIRRTPGDRLRFDFARDSLVFSPEESFLLGLKPHLVFAQPKAALQCVMRLTADVGGAETWAETITIAAQDDGQIPDIDPQTIPIPKAEGSYTLDVEISPRPGRFSPTFIRRTSPLVQRKLQLVVVEPKANPLREGDFVQQFEINPAQTGWWDRFSQISSWTLLPGFGQGPLIHGKAGAAQLGDQLMIALEENAWQAYPLPVKNINKPHILIVEAPANRIQNLGVSIVEPSASGMVGPIGVDSGVYTPRSPLTGSEIVTHRIIFWPRTTQPLVLLTNRGDGPALFGKLRLLAGPDRLPPSPVASAPNQRLLTAYFEKPLFPELMSVSEAVDPWTKRPLDDWNEFLTGAKRLIDYLKHSGYNSVVIPVVCEGSTLYPSRVLQPTPKYDSGAFFVTGQDPRRKDILEMLFRLFDREGLLLIPAVQFNSPLPELERLRHRENPVGLELVDSQGRTYLEVNGAREGLAPYYNPLHPSVQKAMAEVVEELAVRYGDHASFGGLSLSLDRDDYTHMPDQDWGYDDTTVSRFENAMGVVVPGEGQGRFAQRAKYLLGDKKEVWMNWRASEIAALHERLASPIAAKRPGARLLLTGGKLFSTPSLAAAMRPALPRRSSIAEAMLDQGIDARQYADQAMVLLVRPQRITTSGSLLDNAVDIQLGDSAEVDRYFAECGESAAMFYHERNPLKLPTFDKVSPFGADKTRTWLVTHSVPAGAYNRKRFVHAMAASDCRTLLDGGWMPLMGQESASEIFQAYRRLPDRTFATAVSTSQRSQSVVVRSLTDAGQTYLYAINDSPWPITLTVSLEAPVGCEALPLTDREIPALTRTEEGVFLRVELDPYDLVGARLDLPGVNVTDYTFTSPSGDQIASDLMREVDQLKSRISGLSQPTPMSGLKNAGFDDSPTGDSPPSWIFPRTAGVTVRTDSDDKHNGAFSLRLASTGPTAWMRSLPIEAPQTGRLSVWVWLRIEAGQQQPPLRLAIEGRVEGQVYYKFATVGAGERSPALSNQWQPYVFHVDDLPSNKLTDLRIGFDLMGEGEVWIDDIQLHDLWFYENERDELAKNIAVADFQVSQGNIADCQRVLEGYWPQFLLQHAPLRNSLTATRPPKAADPKPKEPPPAPTMFQRMKGYLPSRMLPF